MVRRNLGLPHRLISKNFNCVIWVKGEVLTLKTYPEKPEGIRQPRKVEFYRGEELVVDSRTLWVLIDKGTQKIKRIENDWLEF